MRISLLPYHVAIWTWHCNDYSMYLLFQVYVNIVPHLFSDLSIKDDQPMTEQGREQSWTSDGGGHFMSRKVG